MNRLAMLMLMFFLCSLTSFGQVVLTDEEARVAIKNADLVKELQKKVEVLENLVTELKKPQDPCVQVVLTAQEKLQEVNAGNEKFLKKQWAKAVNKKCGNNNHVKLLGILTLIGALVVF